jgi:hypothetical protein
MIGLAAAALIIAATGTAAASSRIRYANDRIAETFGLAMERSATPAADDDGPALSDRQTCCSIRRRCTKTARRRSAT